MPIRWIRVTVQGFEDTGNVSKKIREGWEFVKVDQFRNEIGENDYPVITEGKYRGVLELEALCWQGYQKRLLNNVLSILKELLKIE